LSKENEGLRDEIELDYKVKVATLMQQIHEQTSEVLGLKQQVRTLQDEKNKLIFLNESQATTTKEVSSGLRNSLEMDRQIFAATTDLLKEEKKQLSDQIEKMRKDNNDLVQMKIELEAKVKNLEGVNESLQTQITNKKAKWKVC
jgi:hypothetical protein